MSDTQQNLFDARNIRHLLSLMKQYELNEMEIQQGDMQLKLKRGSDVVVSPGAFVPAPVAPPVSTAVSAAPAAPAASPAAQEDEAIKTINSPMVGTFYSAADPQSPAYLKVGDMAIEGKTACIIEAMKVFNQVPVDVAGRVVAVLVENGAPVEYGQPLFKVDTRG